MESNTAPQLLREQVVKLWKNMVGGSRIEAPRWLRFVLRVSLSGPEIGNIWNDVEIVTLLSEH